MRGLNPYQDPQVRDTIYQGGERNFVKSLPKLSQLMSPIRPLPSSHGNYASGFREQGFILCDIGIKNAGRLGKYIEHIPNIRKSVRAKFLYKMLQI